VTFSDPKIAAFVNKNFVSAWFNRGPGFFNADLSTERWIFASSMEAYPTKNICTFFLAPDGKVFHYVAGFYSPDLFLKFLSTALDLRKALFDEKMQPKTDGLKEARKIHEERASSMDDAAERLKDAQSQKDGGLKGLQEYRLYSYRGMVHQHGPRCVSNLQAGFDYLGKLHRLWAAFQSLPDLDAVRYAYLWGNPFTEEAAGAQPIADNDAAKVPKPPPDPGAPRKAATGEANDLGLRLRPRALGASLGLPSIFGSNGGP
jgi:hypothetical protein